MEPERLAAPPSAPAESSPAVVLSYANFAHETAAVAVMGPKWKRRIRDGLTLLLISIPLLIFAIVLLAMMIGNSLCLGLAFAGGVIHCLAIWAVTAREPGDNAESSLVMRELLRIFCATAVCGVGLVAATAPYKSSLIGPLFLVTCAMILPLPSMAPLMLGRLGRRAGKPRLARGFDLFAIVVWGGILVPPAAALASDAFGTVVVIAIAVVPLAILSLWYIFLVVRLLKAYS